MTASRISIVDLSPDARRQVLAQIQADEARKAEAAGKGNKYGAKRTTVDGVTFDSKAEAERWCVLRLRERAGEIANLERQPVYEITINGTRVCEYRADFRYFEGGARVVEDVKGKRTDVYRLKKKLVEAAYPGTIIREIQA